jgi:hypothetical protein
VSTGDVHQKLIADSDDSAGRHVRGRDRRVSSVQAVVNFPLTTPLHPTLRRDGTGDLSRQSQRRSRRRNARRFFLWMNLSLVGADMILLGDFRAQFRYAALPANIFRSVALFFSASRQGTRRRSIRKRKRGGCGGNGASGPPSRRS